MNDTYPRADNPLVAMERLFSSKYGLVKVAALENRLNRLEIFTKTTKYTMGNLIPMFLVTVESSKNFTDDRRIIGGGTALTYERSKIKAFGEFIERYCGMYTKQDYLSSIIFDSYENLVKNGISCLDLTDLIPFKDNLYATPNFPFSRYCTQSPISWIKGENLISGESVWLPAQKVFLSYPFPAKELYHAYSLSTGLACGSNFYQAALGAILEVIERDSFMLMWLFKRPGRQIKIDHIQNEALKKLYHHIEKHLVGEDQLFMYDISETNGVYTIFTFIRNDLPKAYGLVVAAASHPSPEIALLKALEELCHTQYFAYSRLGNDQEKTYQRLKKEDVDTLHKHFFYYSNSRHNHKIDFISATKEWVFLSAMTDYSKNTDQENFAYLKDLFQREKQPIYMADLTKPEIRTSGFQVLKAIIPNYVDLVPSHHYMDQKNNRVRYYQQKYQSPLNDNPHPFP